MDAILRESLDKLADRFRVLDATRRKLHATIATGRDPEGVKALEEKLEEAEGLLWSAASFLTWRWELVRDAPKTYEVVRGDGRAVRVTIPERED